MASKPRKKGTRWEVVFKKAGVLDKPLYLFYDSEAEALESSEKVDALLDRGINPIGHTVTTRAHDIGSILDAYERDAHPSRVDRGVLQQMRKVFGALPPSSIDFKRVDSWITEMKRVEHAAPKTIRGKVGAMARAWNWAQRERLIESESNPFRGMSNGYSQYTNLDEKLAGVRREDIARDRRLEDGEEERILATIRAGVLPRKQRPYAIPYPKDLERDFLLAVNTAMRLRERYTLEVHQVRLHQRTIHLDKTKNGDSRNVPLSSVAMRIMTEQIEGKAPHDRVFPWWQGDASPKGLGAMSLFLSKLYISVFEAAGCEDLKGHDLRHEGTSRLFERTQLPTEAIMKITGHRSHTMLMRYLKLRGSDLAGQLW